MGKIQYIVVIMVVIMLQSCSKKTIPQQAIRYIDREVVRDSTVYIPIEVEKQVQIVKEDSSFLSTKYACSTAVVDSSGMLRHTLENKSQDSIPARIQWKDRIIIRDTTIREIQKEPYPVVKYPKSYWWLAGWAVITLLLGVLKFRR